MASKRLKLVGLLSVVAMTVAACGGSGGSDSGTGDVFEFRVADQYSMEHSIGKASIQPYMAAVEEASGGRIKFEYFSDDSLVAAEDIPDAIRSGTADMGNLVYIGNLNPLLYVVQLPGLFSDEQTVEASEAFFEFAKTNGPTQQKFEELQTIPLFCFTVTNYQLLFTDPEVDSLAEVEGKQVRSAGVVLPHSVAALGGTPTDIAINEAYDAFNRGIVDSISLSVPSVKAYAFMELLKSAIVNADLGGFPVCYGIGRSQFESLPDDLQQIMIEEGEKIVTEAAATLMAEALSDLELWEQQGIKLHRVDVNERNRALAGVEEAWINQLESEGVEGAAEAVEQWKSMLQERLG